MARFLSFKSTNIYLSSVRHCRLNVRTSDELIPNIVKYQHFHYNNELRKKQVSSSETEKVHPSHVFDEGMKTSGREIWEIFVLKVRNRELSPGEFFDFCRAVKEKAQCSKYIETPEPVYTLTVCSLAPFCALGVLSFIGGTAFQGLLVAQLVYGASILSYFGGVTSGHAIANGKTDFESLCWSVTPPLIAWLAPLMPLPLGFLATATGFTTTLLHDVLLTSYPDWLKALRFYMSVVVLAALTPAFLTSLFL